MGVVMGKYAVIKNGVVVNIVVASQSFATSKGWIPAVALSWKGSQLVTREAKIGDNYTSDSFVTPEES